MASVMSSSKYKDRRSSPPIEFAASERSSSRARDTDAFARVYDTQTPETDVSSSEDEQPDQKSSTTRSRARAKRDRKASHSNNASVPSLKPAQAILSRIRHDPSLRVQDYVIGYWDRHAPEPMEMDVVDWKGGVDDVTDEDWIPQHRIAYFRKKEEPKEMRVWDRAKRLDRLFGSGVKEVEET